MTKQELSFNDKFVPLILNGTKTSTWRRGNKTQKYKLNDIINLTSSDIPFGTARVVQVLVTSCNHITKQDAISDGFESITNMLDTLRDIYPDLQDNEPMTIIHFNVIPQTPHA